MKNSDVKRLAIARLTEMIDFLIMETIHCNELKLYQVQIAKQLKYDIETQGMDFVIDLLKIFRSETNELKKTQKTNKIYRASTDGAK